MPDRRGFPALLASQEWTGGAEYTGQSGVLNLMQEFGLTKQEALEVSDHFPIWAVFRTSEGKTTPQIARPLEPATR